ASVGEGGDVGFVLGVDDAAVDVALAAAQRAVGIVDLGVDSGAAGAVVAIPDNDRAAVREGGDARLVLAVVIIGIDAEIVRRGASVAVGAGEADDVAAGDVEALGDHRPAAAVGAHILPGDDEAAIGGAGDPRVDLGRIGAADRRVVYDDIFVAADRRSRGIEGAGVDVGIELPAHREAAGLVAMEGRDFGVELVARGRGVDLELGADLGSGIVELLREQAVARALAGNRFPDDDIAAAVEGGDRRLALLADDVRVDGELAADRVAVDIEM